jgi:Tfp pilus assembly protein PilF
MTLRNWFGAMLVASLACAVAGFPVVAAAAEPGSRKALEQAAEVNTELALAYMRENNLKAAREKIDKALHERRSEARRSLPAAGRGQPAQQAG